MTRKLVGILVLCAVAVTAVTVASVLWQAGRRRAERTAAEQPSRDLNPALNTAEERELERIATLGYITGSEPVPERTGVVTYIRGAAFDGLTLLTSAEGPKAILVDMDGNIVHSWSAPGTKYWARARVLPDGSLLAITCAPPSMLKLGPDSQVIWRLDRHAHHDFAVLPDGKICVLVRSRAARSSIHDGAPIIDDNVVLLDGEGRELASVSLLTAFERSELGSEWLREHPFPDDPDIFHTNSIDVVPGGPGSTLLLSIRSIDTVAILDVSSGQIVWARSGPWHRQHEAKLVDDHLLLFDNLGLALEEDGLEQSRVLEVDLATGDLVWSYTEPGFFTRGGGSEQRLPNGNTLITESENGRIVEVDREGRTVWEYLNTLTVRGRPDLILGIPRAQRIPLEHVSAWAGVASGSEAPE